MQEDWGVCGWGRHQHNDLLCSCPIGPKTSWRGLGAFGVTFERLVAMRRLQSLSRE